MNTEEIIFDFKIEYNRAMKSINELYDMLIFSNIMKNDLTELMVDRFLVKEEIFDIIYKYIGSLF